VSGKHWAGRFSFGGLLEVIGMEVTPHLARQGRTDTGAAAICSGLASWMASIERKWPSSSFTASGPGGDVGEAGAFHPAHPAAAVEN